MEKLLCREPSAAPQVCLKPCWADISNNLVATRRLASGAKVAAGAVQIVDLSVERDTSSVLSVWGSQMKFCMVFCFLNSNEKHKEKFQFG